MTKQTGFTKTDLIVTLACVAFVLANAQIISAGGREKAKRDVCITNLRMLTAAWQIYAEDNAGKLVNGASGGGASCQSCCGSPVLAGAMAPTSASDIHRNELPWAGAGWNLTGGSNPASEAQQKCAISTGALWKYTQDYEAYRCPTGIKGEMVSYDIIDSMNGMYKYRGNDTLTASLAAKNLNQITKPAMRILFIEEGRLSPDSFAVYINLEKWFDVPPVRHDDGTNVSFPDGHSAYWKWKAQETINIAKGGIYNFQPMTSAGKQDLYKIQIGCWTKLGYYPTVAPDPNW